ncbi:MAG: TrbG/VirB9 family P-type conjugative transfer protein [Sphingomonadales bacterium]|jgi:type IV secretion system protein VirB9
MPGADRVRALRLAALLWLALPAAASPDPRLQIIPYDPGRIYTVEVAAGYTLMIALAPGERIETMAVGDSSAWQVNANKRGDAIFIKRNYSGINSNLTVITDARTYVFELLGNSPVQPPPLIMRFAYAAARPELPAAPPAAGSAAYRLAGAPALRPASISIAGNQIILAWPAGAALPAVFQIADDGSEALVNGRFEDDRMILQGIPRRLLFRSGRQIATATLTPPRGATP